MTICIAALCEQRKGLVCASDRMITAGDIEFEPPQPKVRLIADSVILLTAGDTAIQEEICQRVRADVVARTGEQPKVLWTVRDVAYLYAKHCHAVRFEKAEQEVLAPLGLTNSSYIQQQEDMDRDRIQRIDAQLLRYASVHSDEYAVGTIVTGFDDQEGKQRGHIYVVRNGVISCEDGTGFASIGYGAWHADSQFMFAGHTCMVPIWDTLWLVYAAKRRAEVAPGIGTATDMFVFGAADDTFAPLHPEVLADLDSLYSRMRQREQEEFRRSVAEIVRMVKDAGQDPDEEEQPSQQEEGGGGTADQANVQDEPEEG